jgi:proliferating cell nuclear antigen
VFEITVKMDVLKEIVGVVSTLVEEVKFNATPEGITIKAVDPAHVAMLVMEIKPEAFEKYDAKGLAFAIEVDKLKDILKLGGADDLVEMQYDEEKNRLIANLGNLKKEMSLLDLAGMSDPKVPQLNLESFVVLSVSELGRGIKASESVSEHVALSAEKDSFTISASGDRDSAELVLGKDELVEINAPESMRSLFSLDYFSSMVKAIGGKGDVKIFLGKEYPMKMAFSIADGNGDVTYLLAPRIEE